MVWLTDEERQKAQEYEASKKQRFAEADGHFVAMSVGNRSVKIDLPYEMSFTGVMRYAHTMGYDLVRGVYDNKGRYYDQFTKIESY